MSKISLEFWPRCQERDRAELKSFGVEVQFKMEEMRAYLNVTGCLGELKHWSKEGVESHV